MGGLNKVVFKLGFPCMAFRSFSMTTISVSELYFSLAYPVAAYTNLVLILLFDVIARTISKKRNKNNDKTTENENNDNSRVPFITSSWMCSSWANTILVGQPLVSEVISPEVAERLPVFHYLISMIFMTPVYATLCEINKTKAAGGCINKKQLAIKVVKGVVLHPVIISTVLGIIWSFTGLVLPRIIDITLAFIKNLVTPIGIFTIGLFLYYNIRHMLVIKPLIYVFMRMFLSPLVVYGMSIALKLNREETITGVTIASTPLAVSCFNMLFDSGTNYEAAPPSILYGSIILFPQQILVQYLLDKYAPLE